jgi:DEAD/DEAH box helicase domain-containing protein
MAEGNATSKFDSILREAGLFGNVVHVENVPPREADSVDLPPDLPALLSKALRAKGIEKLYRHQALCREKVLAGKNVVVLTPTASGKTLCYNLPVIETLLKDPDARCLYLFPTKALSQDQQSELNELCAAGQLPLKVFTYDGDTPNSLRVAARDSGRIVISNPDMLHSGVLPNHPRWIRFFSALKYVVIDEMHAYRGVFGSHVANVMRRLKRVAAFYGAHPTFIMSSATIGNPEALAKSLIGEEVEVVDRNGAPSGGKTVYFYNPSLVDPVQGIRRGVTNETQKIALAFLRAGVKTILFARSRVRTEIIASYINQALANVYTENSRIRVEPYRGGFLPLERREIEKGLRDGSIQGVVSTNALELGIDIGGLDAAVLAGFPGAFSSFWQQAGRAGRRSGGSCAVYVATSSPLDQYLITHPEYFFSRCPETARISPDNPYIFTDHVKCAAFELPFQADEAFGEELMPALDYLEEAGILRLAGGKYHWSSQGYPAEGISLRSATADNIVIIDETKGRNAVIGEMDRPSAKELIFDDAVYIHHGRQYIVKKLDVDRKTCRVEEADVNYYTDAVVKSDIKILSQDSRMSHPGADIALGDVLVRTEATKYKKIRFHTHENIGFGEIYQSEEELQTRAAALLFPAESGAGKILAGLGENRKPSLLGAVGHILKQVAPVFVLCEPADLGVSERVRDPHFGLPAIYLYDRYPGGTGLSEIVAQKIEDIARAASERVGVCGCQDGCPSCLGAPDERPQQPDTISGASPVTVDGTPLKALVKEFLIALAASGAQNGTTRE